MASVTKPQLLESVADKADAEKSRVDAVLVAFFETVVDEGRKGNKVGWPGFGTFSVVARKVSNGPNPQTGGEVKIPASKAMKFSPSSSLKSSLQGKAKKAQGKKAAARKSTRKR